MACTESITDAFGQLCDYFMPEKKRATLGCPLQNRKQIRSHLKQKLFTTLFTYLKNKDRTVKQNGGDNEVEEVKIEYSWLILSLRQRRKFDDANRLEALLEILSDSENKDTVFAVLRVLLKLKDTGAAVKPQVIGHDHVRLPVQPKRKQDDEPLLPDGPLCYGDTQIVQPGRFHYMHYPRSVFEGHALEIINPVTDLCEQLPGSGLSGRGFFSVQGCLGDQYEQKTTESLFGGLVEGSVNSLEIKLDLPELPDDINSGLLETRIPKSMSSYSNETVDEGFKSQEESLTGSTTGETLGSSFDSLYHADYDTSIYETCLSEEISQYYTWETLGRGPGIKCKPRLIEAGPVAFDHLNKAILKDLSTAFPSVRVSPLHEISQQELVSEILNVMIAVPSINFILDLTDQCFTMREGLFVSGMSTQALQHFVDDFLVCGMHFYRLGLFSASPLLNSFYSGGLTFHAFTGAVQKVLHYYSGVVLSIGEGKTLLQLKIACHKLLQEIRFLAELCNCQNPVTEQTKSDFPSGIPLLNYLYKETVEASFNEHYPLMLSLLKQTCTPYLLYVEEWVYHGLYRDRYGEFMIQVNYDYLQVKDKHYWTHGYTLSTDKVEESVPLFLADLANDIFLCGKSINLLRACKRDHFLCDVDDSDIPKIALTFSETELRTLTSQCISYVNKMQQIVRLQTLSRIEMKERTERAKHDLIALARQTAAADLKRIEDAVKEKNRAAAAKKRKELNFLKDQMEKSLKRRAMQKEAEIKEGKDYIDSVTDRENAMDEHELQIEKEAREEIIAYYSQLSDEAVKREQKALWRIRRAKLDIKRTEFLLQQERQLAEEMENFRSDPTNKPSSQPLVVHPANPTLPSWARKGLDGPTVVVMGEDEEDGTEPAPKLEGGDRSLPKWALKGIEKYGIKNKSPSPLRSPMRSPSPRSGRKTPTRRSLNASFHVNDETQETSQKSSIQTFGHVHATKESESLDTVSKSQVKMVGDRYASKETVIEETNRPHIKTVGDKHATQCSVLEPESRPHIRSFDNVHANKRSEEPEHDSVPKLKLGVMHSSSESKPMEWKIKKQNVFGHASQLSSSSEFSAVPMLKKSATMSAHRESDWSTDFAIKPKIRINRKQTANTLSEETQSTRSKIKMSDKMSATKQSEFVDYEQKRVQMFKERNVYGHATDSSVQRLLYDGKFTDRSHEQDKDVSVVQVIPKLEEIEWLAPEVEKYQDDFTLLSKPPQVDLLARVSGLQFGSYYGNDYSIHDDIQGYQYLPLKTIIQSSITTALGAQVSLVNESLVRYFYNDLLVEEHFMALRRYLCMGDHGFSEILCDLLMEKLGTNPRPQDLVNPMFLNNCLNKAVRLSVNDDDKYADNVSFIHKYLPRTLEQTSPDLLDCIQLHYEVKWPLNIVITENILHKYAQVFSFMLQLKRVVWVLKDVWNRLRRDVRIHKLDGLFEFRELHLLRHKMQLFVKEMQEYITNQIVEVTWHEFQTALAKNVHNIDDLHNEHNKYLDNALVRCLLSKNASSLMKVVQGIFQLILKFHRQLVTGSWHTTSTGQKTHSNSAKMKHTYKVFHEHSTFLFKVVSKLADRGYQPHLHDLLLRLNFNHYYEK